MASTYWMKLYHEILDDPKMATLPDRLWRRTIELFLCAGRQGGTGHLPDTKQLAWILRMETDDLDLDLKQIATTGIIQQEQGGWFVVKFADRQAPVDATERVKKFRERQKKQQYYSEETQLERKVTQINRLTESDTDSEKKPAATPRASLVWRDNLQSHFIQRTHLQPPKYETESQAKAANRLWWSPLKEMYDLCKKDNAATIEAMDTAINELRANGLTISDPNSILKTFRSIVARQEVPQYREVIT